MWLVSVADNENVGMYRTAASKLWEKLGGYLTIPELERVCPGSFPHTKCGELGDCLTLMCTFLCSFKQIKSSAIFPFMDMVQANTESLPLLCKVHVWASIN